MPVKKATKTLCIKYHFVLCINIPDVYTGTPELSGLCKKLQLKKSLKIIINSIFANLKFYSSSEKNVQNSIFIGSNKITSLYIQDVFQSQYWMIKMFSYRSLIIKDKISYLLKENLNNYWNIYNIFTQLILLTYKQTQISI